jgi:hypothetical protein
VLAGIGAAGVVAGVLVLVRSSAGRYAGLHADEALD